MILLYGQLKIDFVAGDEPKNSVVHFDTVMEKLYHEAVAMILDGVDGLSDTSLVKPNQSIETLIESWPVHFRNSASGNIPRGQRLLDATQWPAVQGGFGRELAPAAALLATDREVVLVSEEKSWGGGRESKYGIVVTHFPLVRLAKYELEPQARFTILDLEVHASHGGEKLQIVLPSESVTAVLRIMKSRLP